MISEETRIRYRDLRYRVLPTPQHCALNSFTVSVIVKAKFHISLLPEALGLLAWFPVSANLVTLVAVYTEIT